MNNFEDLSTVQTLENEELNKITGGCEHQMDTTTVTVSPLAGRADDDDGNDGCDCHWDTAE